MRKYETMFIIKPGLDEAGTKAVIDKFLNLLKEMGSEIESVEEWGMRRLAYEVEKLREGYYVLVNFSAETDAVEELQRVFNISDDILKYIVINKEKAS